MGGGVKISLLKREQIKFIEGIINEDLSFGFEVFRNAQMIGFFNDVIFYRQREGSVSCAKTFLNHSNALLFRSYKTNCDYLLSLLQKEELKSINPLIKRSLQSCSQMPILCWLKDKSLIRKKDLKPLLPYMKIKTKLAYYFSFFARIAIKIRQILRGF